MSDSIVSKPVLLIAVLIIQSFALGDPASDALESWRQTRTSGKIYEITGSGRSIVAKGAFTGASEVPIEGDFPKTDLSAEVVYYSLVDFDSKSFYFKFGNHLFHGTHGTVIVEEKEFGVLRSSKSIDRFDFQCPSNAPEWAHRTKKQASLSEGPADPRSLFHQATYPMMLSLGVVTVCGDFYQADLQETEPDSKAIRFANRESPQSGFSGNVLRSTKGNLTTEITTVSNTNHSIKKHLTFYNGRLYQSIEFSRSLSDDLFPTGWTWRFYDPTTGNFSYGTEIGNVSFKERSSVSDQEYIPDLQDGDLVVDNSGLTAKLYHNGKAEIVSLLDMSSASQVSVQDKSFLFSFGTVSVVVLIIIGVIAFSIRYRGLSGNP